MTFGTINHRRAPQARPAGKALFLALVVLLALMGAATAQAQETAADAEAFNINVNIAPGSAGEGSQMSDVMKIVLVLSVLTFIPAILLTMTAFTRIVIVLSFVRRALSVQGMPPNQIIIGISLFITFYVMAPVLAKVNEVAIQPVARGEITEIEAIRRAEAPLRSFMLHHTRKKDLLLFIKVSNRERPKTRDDVPTHILVPAFALSEIKTAFQMGFIIFLPMLVVDIVVATLLVSMGMFMLPPPMVSVPIKLLLFVLVDGWHLVIGSLAQSFQ